MKQFLLNILRKAGYDLVSLKKQREAAQAVVARGKSVIQKISPEFKVLNGPFKGMRYPSIDITELTLVPKISGSYEQQLIPVLERVINGSYNTVIDVGSAEGYYAVGMAMRMPASTIHAFDINKKDIAFSREMAILNGVSNITFNEFCSPDTLQNFDFGERSFILCDCEGYELTLFTPDAIRALNQTELLIELHDNVNPQISETLISRFEKSHRITLLNNASIDISRLNGLEKLSPADRGFATFEHRGGLYQNIFMQWMFLEPKVNAQ